MIPSFRWFPTNVAERKAFFTNLKINFPTVSDTLGLKDYDTQVVNDCLMYEFLADVFTQIKSYEEAVRQFRKILTEGDIGDVTPQFPSAPNFVVPTAVATGIFERTDKLRDKILTSDNYTDEIGAILRILSKPQESLNPEEVKPTIQNISPAQTGYLFSITVGKRENADMWDVLILKKGGTWQKAGSFTGKSGDVTVTPTTQGESEQIQVRIQLRKNNQNYGQPSDIVYVTVNP